MFCKKPRDGAVNAYMYILYLALIGDPTRRAAARGAARDASIATDPEVSHRVRWTGQTVARRVSAFALLSFAPRLTMVLCCRPARVPELCFMRHVMA